MQQQQARSSAETLWMRRPWVTNFGEHDPPVVNGEHDHGTCAGQLAVSNH